MDLTLSTCFVLVHDPDLALAFYRDALGLELRNDVAREDFRWITVGAASQPGVGIVLTNYLNGSPADNDALAALIAKGALNGVHFHTDDLDATFEKVRAAGRRDRAGADRRSRGARGTSPCATRPATWCASTSRPPLRDAAGPGRAMAERRQEQPSSHPAIQPNGPAGDLPGRSVTGKGLSARAAGDRGRALCGASSMACPTLRRSSSASTTSVSGGRVCRP